jgi:transcription antitermination factor NusG
MQTADQSWILCRSKPNQQKWAMENVRRVRPDYECYLPRWYNPDLRRIDYMFGTYMFVRVIARQWHCLQGVWGLASVLIGLEGLALTVLDSDIEKIKRLENRNGLVQLDLRRLQPGAGVRIVAGPLQFQVGRFARHGARGRVYVVLDLLGKETRVELDEKIVAAM